MADMLNRWSGYNRESRPTLGMPKKPTTPDTVIVSAAKVNSTAATKLPPPARVTPEAPPHCEVGEDEQLHACYKSCFYAFGVAGFGTRWTLLRG